MHSWYQMKWQICKQTDDDDDDDELTSTSFVRTCKQKNYSSKVL